MTTQPEALRLADKLEGDAQGISLGAEGMGWGPSTSNMKEAAAELRRLYAEVDSLKSGYQGACYACEPVAEENIRLQNLNKDLEDWVYKLKEENSYIRAYPQNYEREWVGLTEKEKQEWIDAMPYTIEPRHCMILVNIMEAKLKEKNT